jgi:hypothetical protein
MMSGGKSFVAWQGQLICQIGGVYLNKALGRKSNCFKEWVEQSTHSDP